MNGAAAARDTNNELPPLARPPTPRGEWRQLIAHQRPTQHTDPRCTLRPPGRGALSLFGPLASPGLIWRWPALGCAPAARRGGDRGGRRPCRVRAQRGRGCAARRGRALGSRGMARGGGTPACPRSSQPHTQAEPRTAAREFGRVSKDRAWRRTRSCTIGVFRLPPGGVHVQVCVAPGASWHIHFLVAEKTL